MPCVCELTPEHVLGELAAIAFAEPGAGNGAVKVADKLRALEMLYRHLQGDSEGGEGVVIIDEA